MAAFNLEPVIRLFRMLDIALDAVTHDLIKNDFDLVIYDGAEQVRQQLAIKLKLWRGEWFLDTEFGTPYYESILGKRLTLGGAVAALKQSILEVEGVKSITRFEYTFNRSARTLDVDFDVMSRYGLITYAT